MHEAMPWLWRDTRRLVHRVSKKLDTPAHVTQIMYVTWCGTRVEVDDVNPRTKVHVGTPSCVRCAVAQEPG